MALEIIEVILTGVGSLADGIGAIVHGLLKLSGFSHESSKKITDRIVLVVMVIFLISLVYITFKYG